MNDIVKLILARRSHREFDPTKPVDVERLREIVRCGCTAPSSKNAQPWRFHVVSDATVLKRLADMVEHAEGADSYVPSDPATGLPRDWESTVAESAQVLRMAPTCIFVENRAAFSGGRATLAKTARTLLADVLVGYTLEVLGVGAAVQNMVVAANALGLQCVYMGDVLIAEPAIRTELGMEGDLAGVLALGYSTEELPPRGHLIDPSDPRRAVWHGQDAPVPDDESPA